MGEFDGTGARMEAGGQGSKRGRKDLPESILPGPSGGLENRPSIGSMGMYKERGRDPAPPDRV